MESLSLQLGGVLLLFVRLSAFIGFAPLFGNRVVPRTVKIGLAMALTLFWWPAAEQIAGEAPVSLHSWGRLVYAIVRETVLGAGLGWTCGLILLPLRIAGELIAQEMGLTIATLTAASGEPNRNVLTELLDGIGMLLLLAVNGHYLLLLIFNACLSNGSTGSSVSQWDIAAVISTITHAPAVGLQLTAPLIVLLLGTTVLLLFTMRQNPQLNLFTFGMPLRLFIGLLGLCLFLPEMLAAFQHLVRMAGTTTGLVTP